MIIWGTRTSNVEVAHGEFHCPKCEASRAYRHMQAKRWFTLYFIPLIPMGKRGEWWECQTCTRAYEPIAVKAVTAAPDDKRKVAF